MGTDLIELDFTALELLEARELVAFSGQRHLVFKVMQSKKVISSEITKCFTDLGSILKLRSE